MENGQTVLLACIYISPVNSVAAVITSIHKVLGLYTPEIAAITGSDNDKMPIILTGDFNVNFASEEANPLIEFLKRTLNLTINTDARCHVCQVDRETIRFVLHTHKEHLLALRYTGTNEQNHNYTEHVQYELRNT
ncbi:hypothetical protein TNCV_1683851 [Trichonephila clavipes]|nr:hypothetical protein TNCV_1683851 [Trichonephila clavipes]